MKKKIITIIMIFIMIFNFNISVFAGIPEVNPNVPESYQRYREFLIQLMSDIGYVGTLPIKGLQVMVTEFLDAMGLGTEADQIQTEQDAVDWINNGINVNGDNVSVTGRQYQFIKYVMNNQINSNSFRYYYSLRLSDIGNINNQTYISIINQYYKEYWIICYSNFGKLMLLPKEYTAIVYRSFSNNNVAYVDFYDVRSGNNVFADGCLNFTNGANTGGVGGQATNVVVAQTAAPVTLGLSSTAFLVSNQYEALTVYDLYNGNISGNTAPYYLKDSYNTNTTKDSYNTTSSSIDRSINIGDITNYINDYVDDNDDYPTPTEINVYIDNYMPDTPTPTPTPTPDNPSGGGLSGGATATANNSGITINNNHSINIGIPSLSGNTVSGNGSGSSGGFFDWISDIGGVIGDFISNVGQLLADAIRGIAEAISSILETVPNVLSSIVEFVYGGLPDELKALVTLGITAVVFVSVIKILRK